MRFRAFSNAAAWLTGIETIQFADRSWSVNEEFWVNMTTANNQGFPSITGLSDGGFVVTL